MPPAPPAAPNMTEINQLIRQIRQSKQTTIRLAGKSLEALPEELLELKELERLQLNGNMIRRIPDEIAGLPALKELSISNNQVEALGEALARLRCLEILAVNNNRLSLLPEWIGQLSSLTLLQASCNRLKAVPETIERLHSLEILNLANNQIETVPDFFHGLPKLVNLSLGNNRLAALPPTLWYSPTLERLGLISNQIEHLPPDVGNLSGLKTLDLRNNDLKELPESLGNLRSLERLMLSDNQLQSLPESLLKLQGLTELYLHGNPELGLPQELLGPTPKEVQNGQPPKPPGEILKHYFSRKKAAAPKAEAMQVMEAKILVLGEAETGKSSLITALVENRKRERSEGGTRGIVRTTWRERVANRTLAAEGALDTKTLRMNTWDFEGQELIRSSHLYFLTQRAVYLIVINRRLSDQQNNLEYWLRLVETHGGPKSSVFLVVNHSDQPGGPRFDAQALRSRFPAFRSILYTSCETSFGIDFARQKIVEAALDIVNLSPRAPVAWRAAKQALEKLQVPSLTLSGWQEHCLAHGITDTAEQREFLDLCDRLGTVRHISPDKHWSELEEGLDDLQEQTPADARELRQVIFLDPEWLARGIRHLFESTRIRQNGGLFSESVFFDVLKTKNEYGADGVSSVFKAALRHFGMLFTTVDGRMLIPLLLPGRKPELQNLWAPDSLRFEYRYRDGVPSGLLASFIVRMHRYLDKNNPPWRHGCALLVFIRSTLCHVLVSAVPEAGNAISIAISGRPDVTREALDSIRHTFDHLHAELGCSDLAKEYIPVPGHPQAEMLEYARMRLLELDGCEEDRVMGPDGRLIRFNVREALGGVSVSRRNRERDRDDDGGAVYNISIHETNISDVGSLTTQDSFNAQQGVPAKLLKALQDQFSHLPPPEATLVEKYVEIIQREASKNRPDKAAVQDAFSKLTMEAERPEAKPRNSFLRGLLSRKGLVEASNTAAEMMPGLLKAAGEVTTWVLTRM